MDRPLVSVVIPVYNPSEDSFCACMDSVLAQLYDELEVILVDDGSTTDGAALIDRWAQRDERVKVIHQNNGGVGSARNHGIERAHGKYISFVDADDCVISSWISRAVAEAEKKEADVIYGSVYMIKPIQEEIIPKENMKIYSRTYERTELWNVQELLLSSKKNPLPGLPYLDYGPYGKLFRTELVKKTLFPIDLPLMEDQVFNHEILMKCQKVVITNIPAYYYIINVNSATHQSRPDAINIMTRALEQIRTFLYDRPEVINAFYYRVINEIAVGIRISYFCKGGERLSFWNKYEAVKENFSNKKVDVAVQKIKLDENIEWRTKIKIQLLKHRIYLPFVLMWS